MDNRFVLMGLAFVCLGYAINVPADPQQNAAEAVIKRFLEQEAHRSFSKVEVSVDRTNAARQLAPCSVIEPFLPPGAKLWGRLTAGARCTAGADWVIYRVARVRVFGPAVVSRRPLTINQVLTSDDYQMAEIELSQQPKDIITDPEELMEKSLARAIPAGQPLRREMLRVKTVVLIGDSVRIAYVGAGFTVTADGKALGNAAQGQQVRVQVDTGRVVTGVAFPGKRVEVRF